MRSQIEKNKEILWEEMERIGCQKLNPSTAERLSVYRDAYKALLMLCDGNMRRDGGNAHSEDHIALTKETAADWTRHMRNEDGTTGPHFTMDQTEQARKQRDIDCDATQFFVAMNMIYSDYCKIAEKVNCSNMDFYSYMAKAFLDDKDAEPHKLARYYTYIVKK